LKYFVIFDRSRLDESGYYIFWKISLLDITITEEATCTTRISENLYVGHQY